MGIIIALTLFVAFAMAAYFLNKREKDSLIDKVHEIESPISGQEGQLEKELKEKEDHKELNEQKEEKQKELMNTNEKSASFGTRELFIQTLKEIGCQPTFAEEDDDDRIFFAYQGEHFFANANDEGLYVHIWDTHWGHVELYDIDEVSRLKRAINNSNLNCSTITVYTIDEEGKSVDVHCKSTFPFIEQMPELGNYLRGELNDFFRAHRLVTNEMEKLRENEQAMR